MGKPPSKSIVEKEKSTNTRVSTSASIQRRTSAACNSTRRRTIGAAMNDGNHGAVNNDDAVALDNTSIAPPHSDMSGDDDDESQQSTSTQKKISPSTRTRTSLINEYADKMSSNEYKCKLCSKIYRCGTGTNANIRRHLANTHGKTHLYSKSQIPVRPNSVAPTRKKKLDEAAIKAIVIDARSFGDFRRAGMQSFLHVATPGYNGPAARTVQRNLKRLYNEKKIALKEQLTNIQYVSITADTWCSSRKRHYLCITAHFISPNYEQHGTILSFRQFHGRSFAMRLRRHIRTVLAMFGLDKGKVCVTTTDNGSDIRKATQYMKVFGIRLHCIAHGLNLVVQKSLNLWPKPKSMTNCSPSASAATTNESNDDEHVSSDASSDDGSITERRSSHGSNDQDSVGEETDGTGDLNSDDDSSKSDDEDAVVLDVQDIGALMMKCRKLIGTIRKSSILNDALLNLTRDSISVALVSDMKIRWNSTYKMIQRLILYQHALAAFYDNLDALDGVTPKQRTKLLEVKLKSLDWNLLLAIRGILERFNDATEILSGKSYPTLSLAYPVIYSLYNYLNHHSGDATENAIKEIMVEKFDEYILPIPDSKHADILFSSAFLDPLVHETLLPEHKSKAEKFLLNEVKKYQKTNSIIQNVSQNGLVSSAASQTASSKSSMMLKKFLTKCGVNSIVDAGDQSRALTIQQEIARMISLPKSDEDFSSFWQKHETTMPLLAAQARKYLAISATSVPSESAFSVSNYVLRKNRLSLTSKNLKYCMFLKDKLAY